MMSLGSSRGGDLRRLRGSNLERSRGIEIAPGLSMITSKKKQGGRERVSASQYIDISAYAVMIVIVTYGWWRYRISSVAVEWTERPWVIAK
jgi:hypothetical protein